MMSILIDRIIEDEIMDEIMDDYGNGDDDWALIFGVPKERLKDLDCFMVEGITLRSAMCKSGCVIGEDGDVVLSKKVGQKTFVRDDVPGTIHSSNIFYVWAVAWANK
jgi:hypothetical protein